MKTGEIAETWTAREAADEASHLASCRVCRERLRPRQDQKLYAVKNARTREFVHVLVNGESLESKLGWFRDEILYSMLIEDGAPKGPSMSEETKAKLRIASEKRKAENKLKRLVRANTPARPVEGGQERREEQSMTKKKPEAKKPKRIVVPAKGSFESQLPGEFVRSYKGTDYKVAKVGDRWQVNGGKTMTIHEAKDFILAQHKSAGRDWTAGVFFLKNRVRV